MASKNAPKNLIVCPEISSDRPGTIEVTPNSNGTAWVLNIKMLVGSPTTKQSKKGKNYTQSGVLKINQVVDIGGVPHRITLNSGWYEGKRVGDPEIVVKPVEVEETTTAPEVTIPW